MRDLDGLNRLDALRDTSAHRAAAQARPSADVVEHDPEPRPPPPTIEPPRRIEPEMPNP